MANAIRSDDFGFCPPQAAKAPAGAGPWLGRLARRVGDSFDEHGRKDAERMMIRLLEQSGGRLTDSIEREMAMKLFEPGGFAPQ